MRDATLKDWCLAFAVMLLVLIAEGLLDGFDQ